MDSLVKHIHFYVILVAVIVVFLLTFIKRFVWAYMDVNKWNICFKYTEEMHTAWRIAMRKICNLHPCTHNNLI